MEDGRIWPPMIILAALVGGIFAYRYFEKVDAANLGLANGKIALEQAQQGLDARKDLWKYVETANSNLAAARKREQEIVQIQNEADSKQRLIEGDLSYIAKSMKDAVAKVREMSSTTEIPELKLTSGKVLKGAKIRKVDDDSVTLFHSEGISVVKADELPEELLEKLQVGPKSLLRQLQALQTNIGQVQPEEKTDSSLLRLKRRIAHVTTQIDSTDKFREKMEAEVSAYEDQIKVAEANKIPSFNIRTMRDVAEGNAGRVRLDLNALKAELEKLNAELQVLTSKQ